MLKNIFSPQPERRRKNKYTGTQNKRITNFAKKRGSKVYFSYDYISLNNWLISNVLKWVKTKEHMFISLYNVQIFPLNEEDTALFFLHR